MKSSGKETAAIYEIRVLGELGPGWSSAFGDLAQSLELDGERRPTTTLTGLVADQAKLRGMLCKLWDLNLTLISVRRIESQEGENR